jgi:dienelactone hydrolase
MRWIHDSAVESCPRRTQRTAGGSGISARSARAAEKSKIPALPRALQAIDHLAAGCRKRRSRDFDEDRTLRSMPNNVASSRSITIRYSTPGSWTTTRVYREHCQLMRRRAGKSCNPTTIKMKNKTMTIKDLRKQVSEYIGFAVSQNIAPCHVIHDEVGEQNFTRKLITYQSNGEAVEAYLFEPHSNPTRTAAVVLHQHNSQWHLGKSEAAGIAGDPFQAFGPALANAGITVLAPDAIGFEARRQLGHSSNSSNPLAPPLNPDRGSTLEGWLQFYNHAMHRLAKGELLMRSLLIDVAHATGMLRTLVGVESVGVIGHSFGGILALFAGALDERLAFTVSSGAACSYRYKFAHGVGLDMALVIPGFAARFDMDDLMRCIAPRPLLVVSSDDDALSADASELVSLVKTMSFAPHADRLRHIRTAGGHALDASRFKAIVEWVSGQHSPSAHTF